jgi:small acid-soluble spore protein H (minor)
MDIERANEILASPYKIKVTYRGEPVWIDEVDATTRTAQVQSETDPGDIRTVPVHDLKEES